MCTDSLRCIYLTILGEFRIYVGKAAGESKSSFPLRHGFGRITAND